MEITPTPSDDEIAAIVIAINQLFRNEETKNINDPNNNWESNWRFSSKKWSKTLNRQY